MLQELIVLNGLLSKQQLASSEHGKNLRIFENMPYPFVSFMAKNQILQLQELSGGPVELPSKSYAGMNAYNHFQAEFANCKKVNNCITGTLTCERMCQQTAKSMPDY